MVLEHGSSVVDVEGVLESLSISLAVLDDAGVILAVNEAWRAFGARNGADPATSGVGSNYLAVCERTHGTDQLVAREVGAAIREVLSGRLGSWTTEYACHSPTCERWFEVRITPIKGGSSGRAVLTHSEITGRVRAEQALRDREEQFRQIVETSRDWIWETDEKLDFVYSSPSVERLLGYGPSELLSRTPFDLMSAEESLRVQGLCLPVVQAREAISDLEATYLHRDGRRVLLETLGSPRWSAQGRYLGYRGICRDITARRNLEDQVRQTQKLEAIGQLAGGVAHDFNNILAVVLMHLGLVLESGTFDAQTTEDLREIERQANRGAELSRQLLLFSRRSVMRLEPVDLDEVIAHLLKMLRRLIGAHITLQFTGAATPPLVLADAGMLEQVVTNLALNARDAMAGGGTLSLTTTVEIHGPRASGASGGERRAGRFVCLSVQDSGCGMSEAVRLRIFEPFFTTKPPGEGTGLGLATAHGIVEQHRGWMEVTSAVGEGSTFRVYLPALEEAPGGDETLEARASELQRGRETLLVVEDETALRNAIRLALSGLGYRVLTASTGAEALALWNQRRGEIDLVLTDQVMPGGMTGSALMESIRAADGGVPMILASGYARELVADVVSDYLPKPFTLFALAEKVRAALDRREPAPAGGAT